ncbi:MAG: hypothetical protein LIO99_03265 [Clostridiales bacterium]|nr:hypothetical protein [Clostridiales bacterium]MCC8105024.1 hypothetical protein [Clostridiales bacterium]
MEMVSDSAVSDRQKEHCAVNTMRRMLEKYSNENHIDFEEAFLEFASSRTYEAIFDFETGIWKEGPDYFMDLYEEELTEQSEA